MQPHENRIHPAEAVIIRHLLTYLGQPQEEWRPGGSNAEGGNITLVRYELQPEFDWAVLGSFGLSGLPLAQAGDQEIRQEILVCWPEEEMTDSLIAHVYSVAQMMAVTGDSLGRGAILPIPDEPLLDSGSDEPYVAWFASAPYFLPEAGALCEEVDPPLLIVWLLPLYQSEADFAVMAGPEAFEQRILSARDACFSWPRPALA